MNSLNLSVIKPKVPIKIGTSKDFKNHSINKIEDLRRIINQHENIIIGPWFSELGFEVLYWIPWLRHLLAESGDLNIVTVSRGGMEIFYSDLSQKSTHVNVLNFFEPKEWSQIMSLIWSDLGGLKQSKYHSKEGEILKLVLQNQNIDISKSLLIHPMLMFDFFRPFWRNNFNFEFIVEFLNLDYSYLKQFQSLGSSNSFSTKFYSRPSFMLNPNQFMSIEKLLLDFAEFNDLSPIMFVNQTYEDDHKMMQFDLAKFNFLPGIVDLSQFYQNNLHAQIQAISTSSLFVGTYGGLSYIPLCFGIPSIGFYTDKSKFESKHLDLAYYLAKLNSTNLKVVDFADISKDTNFSTYLS